MIESVIRVAELFAGVGGFRIGLEGWKGMSASSGYTKRIGKRFKVVWGNQWEPSTKRQYAYEVYSKRFPGDHSNIDIEKVIEEDFENIPDFDLLCGGFPCQDYSVARTLNQAAGLQGKKGVLWWSIHAILSKRMEAGNPVSYLMLENVDRLLKSPASQRGRDFSIMLSSLANLGYAVEWRVINAADYGMPQRRRRVFFIGYHSSTKPYDRISKLKDRVTWITDKGVLAKAFPIKQSVDAETQSNRFLLSRELSELTDKFNKGGTSTSSPFKNSGIMVSHEVMTMDSSPSHDGDAKTLGDILVKDESGIDKSFFIDARSLKSWRLLKGAKKETRYTREGHRYEYSEGSMVFPDPLDRPSRTIVTGEGGSSPSRFKHVIQTSDTGVLRRLTPLELERLNMFPDGHTDINGVSDVKRAFFMGNALVVGIVEMMGSSLYREIMRK